MTTQELFDSQFKFQINQSVKHKGDTKDKHVSDLGLLILSRVIIEQIDDDGNPRYNRVYECRVLRFSGSGEVITFKESELMSESDYIRMNVELDMERQEIREEMYESRERIFKHFGVKRKSIVKLKSSDKLYKVTGFKSTDGINYKLTLQAVDGNSVDNSIEISSAEEIELSNKPDEAII